MSSAPSAANSDLSAKEPSMKVSLPPGAAADDTKDLLAAVTPQQRALLDRLAAGHTSAAAAESEFVSLRTANRHIEKVRAMFGVRTTREAVLAYRRHGTITELTHPVPGSERRPVLPAAASKP
ncbi:hypothetical protein [Actinoplanes sp. HUAS TT8]|uniref:hypothetical protein n=1 Tax=Actinoplanes sp. HUAS TT8 TaxID=3447453 RepID=UPI003F52573B